MSQISTTPVIKCKRCERMLIVTEARTFAPDPEKKELHNIMKTVFENALCAECNQRRSWYANQGRIEDWEAGNP